MMRTWSAPTITSLTCPALALCLGIVISANGETINLDALTVTPGKVEMSVPEARPLISVQAQTVTINTKPVSINGGHVTICSPDGAVLPAPAATPAPAEPVPASGL